MSSSAADNEDRELTREERDLATWMLEHGTPDARHFLPQLEAARATSWRCKCGCASFNFSIPGHPAQPGAMTVIADFVFGAGDELAGIMLVEKGGILSGVEIYGLAGNTPTTLPAPAMLQPFRK